MDFGLSEEQILLRDTARDLFARSYDVEKRNEIIATELGWSRDVWGKLAELGILGLPFTEDDGGADAGPIETMTVVTELGRRLAPEPVIDAVYVPGGIIVDAGTPEQRRRVLPAVAEGETLLAFAHQEPGTRWPTTDVATKADRNGDTWIVSGRKHPVPHGDCADLLVVSAATTDGIALFLVDATADGVSRTGFKTYDGSRGAQIEFAGAAAELLGEGAEAAAAIVAADIRGQALLAAEALGAMEESLRLTTEYLKTRKQFGVPLAKFQTLTQRAADMYVSLELARSMALYANMSLADGALDPVVASRTKVQIGRSGRHIGQEAIQLHGGIGVTAEYPVGHYLARLTSIEHALGTTEDHLRVLADAVSTYDQIEL